MNIETRGQRERRGMEKREVYGPKDNEKEKEGGEEIKWREVRVEKELR